MNKSINRKYNYLKFLFFIVYLADSLYYSYTSLFLSKVGFGEGMIGTIGSVTTITYLVANPVWNIFVKNSKRIKYMILSIAIISGVIIGIYGNLSTVELIILFTALLASVIAPFYTLLDGYTINFSKKNDREYSGIRVMGSAAYIFGTAIGGYLVDLIGFRNLFFLSGFIFILAGILVLFLKPINNEEESGKTRNLKEVFKNKWFFAYLILYLFLISSNVIGDNFVSLLFTKIKQLSTFNYGLIGAGIILTEVITLIILGKIGSKIKDLYLLAIAGFGYFARSILLSFVDLPLPILIFGASLRGVAWGTFLFIHFKYLVKLVGLENTTSAALIITTAGGLYQFIGLNIFGYMFENIGYGVSYRIIGLLCLFTCLAFITFRFFYERKISKEN